MRSTAHSFTTRGSPVLRFDRVYDKAGNPRGDSDSFFNDAQAYQYDSGYRLTTGLYGLPAAAISGLSNNNITNADVAPLFGQAEKTVEYLLDGAANFREVTTTIGGVPITDYRSVGPLNEYLTAEGATHTYDASGVLTDAGFTGSTFGYTGAVMDEESGLAYMRNRYYSARLGRFINTDPIGFAGGVNLYAYADANPLAMWDPMGLDPEQNEGANDLVDDTVEFIGDLSTEEQIELADDVIGTGFDVADATQGIIFVLSGGLSAPENVGWLVWRTGLKEGLQRLVREALEKGAARTARELAEKGFKAFTARNFRENLARLTGKLPAEAQAHHVFPQQFQRQFEAAGINIHDPKFGSWWSTSSHQQNAFQYNQEWGKFLGTNPPPSSKQILEKGRQLGEKYGFEAQY